MNNSKIGGSLFISRQARLSELMRSAGLDFIALNPGPSLTYLTGLNFHLMERPIVACLPVSGNPTIMLPELESPKLENLDFPISSFLYGEDPSLWSETFRSAMHLSGMESRIVGVEPTQLRFLELRLLETAAPGTRFISAESILGDLRICKDVSELAAMRKAVEIAQNALEAILPGIKAGMTEKEIAAQLIIQLFRHGSDPNLPFAPIVSSGPNSANPHASPSDRVLQNGDLLVIDWGAACQGYVSDLTRTFAVGEVEPEFIRIAQIVLEANSAGRSIAAPELPAETVDQAARHVITASGYGDFFIHRTGHGIGMEGHEAPYIRQGNRQHLLPGMAFTIEPGIYLPGRGGVRIEDDLVITAAGSECLSSMPAASCV